MSASPPSPQQPDSQTRPALSGEVLRISPQQFHFTASRVSPGQVSKVKLKNVSSSPVGYKFKTNAPMKYSVKPVLGVLAPDESVKIFVRCDNWVSPQDRFLLQSIILTDDEKKTLDSRTWKSLDPKRFIECYIPCVSVSALTLRDPEDDAGSLSSSSAASSSTTISPPLQAIDLTRLPPPQSRQQVFERWQYSESMRPTVSMGGVGKRLSNSSTTSTSPGVYPTLFTSKNSMDYYFPSSPTTPTGSDSSAWSSKRNSFSSTSTVVQSPIITSTIVEEPVSMLDGTSVYHVKSTGSTSSSSANNREVPGKLVVAKGHALRTQSWIQILWEYTRGRILLLSLVCLFLGLVLPLSRSTTRWQKQDQTAIVNTKDRSLKDMFKTPTFDATLVPDMPVPVQSSNI